MREVWVLELPLPIRGVAIRIRRQMFRQFKSRAMGMPKAAPDRSEPAVAK
jgi:hypothetical protein